MAGPTRVNGLSHEHITSILEDKEGVLWVGTLKGLNRYDNKNNRFTSFYSRPDVPGSLSNDEIFSICEDLSGVLWIGTHLGLNKCEKKRNEFTLFTPGSGLGLSNGLVRAIGEHQGLLWVGTYDGLNIIDRKNRSCRVLRHEAGNTNSVSNDRIMSIYRDPSGKYWLGTHDGLDMYDPVSESFTHFRTRPNDPSSLSNPRVRVVYGDRSRRIWVGTENGLNRMERDQSSFRRFLYNPADTTSISDNYIYSILQDREGNLWVGTLNGLNCYNQTEKRFRRFMADPNRKGTLSDNAVMSLYEDSEGTLWVGTSVGLNRFNRERNQFDQYTRKDGLPNDMICAILEDERGRLWLSTNRGLCRMEKKTKRFRNYSESDGLQSDEFNLGAAFRSPRGEMFFGGINGFNAFFPDSIKEDFVFPKVVVTDFQIYNRSVPIGKMDGRKAILDKAISETDSIVLSHRDRSFSFGFAALHYHSPEKNQYAYRMEGLEKEWNYVSSRRFVTYTNLPPRKYVFRVRASNSDGIWSPNGVSVHIRIVPPFYNTWWFKVSLMFSTIFLIWSLYFVRTRSITLRNRELEKRVQARTAELESVNQELKDFAYIVSHDLKAPLRAIGSLADWIFKDYYDHIDKPGREMLQLMTSRVKRMNDLIDGILQYSRIGRIREKKVSVDLNQIVKHVVDMIAPPDNIKIEIANELPVIECEETRIMQVYQNLIGNAVKYMDKPEGKVSIGCEKESDHWTFRISDNGPGIDPCYHDKIFQIFQTISSKDRDSTGIGLSLVKKIVEMYGGRIWVESQAGHGSTFIFTLPN